MLSRLLLPLLALSVAFPVFAHAQRSLDAAVTQARAYELGQAVLLLMVDRGQQSIPWTHRATAAIRWLDAGYGYDRDGTVPVRRGLIRVHVQGKPARVLRQRLQELWWTVRLVGVSNPNMGAQTIRLEPGLPDEGCFGSLYEGCDFTVLPSLRAAGIAAEERCRREEGFGGQTLGYRLRHPQRAPIDLQVATSVGAGGSSTWLTLRLPGTEKPLCD